MIALRRPPAGPIARRAARRAWPVLASSLFIAGCLDQGDPERVGYSSHVLERGTDIPSVEDDPVLKTRIASNAGVGETVPLRSAYVGGREVSYWDLGEGSSSAEPLWQFRRRNGDGEPEEVGHPDLIDTAPGDDGYSPIRALYVVYVTRAYDGERIVSFQALEDAIELGLVEDPQALGVAVNWPVVPAATVLETAEGDAPIEPSPVYYRGRVATVLRIGGDAERVGRFPMMGPFPVPNAYVLRRQNELDALDEAAFQLDLNADGDMQDSNVVFSVDVGQPGYSSIWRQVDVIVPADYEFGASRAEDDLFVAGESGLSARAGVVVEYAPADAMFNRPIRYVAP